MGVFCNYVTVLSPRAIVVQDEVKAIELEAVRGSSCGLGSPGAGAAQDRKHSMPQGREVAFSPVLPALSLWAAQAIHEIAVDALLARNKATSGPGLGGSTAAWGLGR